MAVNHGENSIPLFFIFCLKDSALTLLYFPLFWSGKEGGGGGEGVIFL